MKRDLHNLRHWHGERGGGDTPVIIVSLCAAVFVVAFVGFILFWLPNYKLQKVLTGEVNRLTQIVTEKNEALGDASALQTSLQDVVKEEEQLVDAYSEKAQTPHIKKFLTKVFLDENFKVDHYFFGEARPGKNPLWTETPVEFRIRGSKERLSKAIAKWRKEIPVNVRLLEADVKKADGKNIVSASFALTALFLAPLDQTKSAVPVQAVAVALPPEGYFENKSNKDRRDRIQTLIRQIQEIDSHLGEAGLVKERQKRLEDLLSRRANYLAEREREFDLLSRQLKDILPKLSKGENHRIILKVQETLVEKKLGENNP